VVAPDVLIPLEIPTNVEVSEAEVASPSDPTAATRYNWQWDHMAIEAPAASAAGRLGSSSVRVAILDTGLDYLNVDLDGLVDLSLCSVQQLSQPERDCLQCAVQDTTDLPTYC
jgi:hypothetical protein